MLSSSAAESTVVEANAVRQMPAPAFFDAEAWAAKTAWPGEYFDEFAAARACKFFPRYLKHTKGKWAGQPFELDPWQQSVTRAAFGWKRADGTRRFRIIWCEIGRKNGKTTFAGGIGLFLAFADNEAAAEVYCAASNEQQAMICFTEAKRMRSRVPYLLTTTNAFKHNISCTETFSKLEALTSRSETKDGLNVHGLIGDEVRKWHDRNFYEVLHTSQGARTQPLEFLITTAGDGEDMQGIGYEMHEHAVKVRDGVVEDHELLPVIYAADKDDDIEDPRTWAKANPNLGRSVSFDFLAREAKRAREMPRYLNAFKRFYLNIWTEAETIWIPGDKWDACNLRPVTLEQLRGRKVKGGLDLAAVTDLNALALVAPWDDGQGYDIWTHFWMPRGLTPEALRERIKRDRVPYDLWAEQGLLTLTEGDVADYDVIRAALTGVGGTPPASWGAPLREICDIVDIGVDMWNATQIVNNLTADGIPMVAFGQGYRSLSAPSKELERLVLDRKLNHGGNPVLRWMMACTTTIGDPAGNIKPVKPDRKVTSKRIDGIVATIMGLGRWLAVEKDETPVIEVPEDWSMVPA